MDDDGGLGFRNWYYYEQPSKGNLGLQLMSSVVERETKPPHCNGGFFNRDSGVSERLVQMDLMRDCWIPNLRDNKILNMLPVNRPHHQHQSDCSVLPDPPVAHNLQMLQHPEPLEYEKPPVTDEPVGKNETPIKKRSQGRAQKSPKPKRPKKAAKPKAETEDGSVSRGKASMKSAGMVINGISFDMSGIPTPVCSCTGKLQQCYRWGAGGWQSACCTTNMSMYPLPMSTKRRGARIAGRKMSHGAFKKVLEKLIEEGQDLSNPIDLRPFWAKHGTNKFVTIR
ncbi:protein Barley B recombinant-like [Canna indica]|uniref:GAGA-binding transcriptional activator n=1 Tax=Canna indica TaxID=4628 RepID=A0AAQ3QH83_9LILI|nr:protein Barley B recombinant-like [Canna indica]